MGCPPLVKGAIATGIGCEASDVTVKDFDKDKGTATVVIAADPAPSKEAIAKAFDAAGGKYKVN